MVLRVAASMRCIVLPKTMHAYGDELKQRQRPDVAGARRAPVSFEQNQQDDITQMAIRATSAAMCLASKKGTRKLLARQKDCIGIAFKNALSSYSSCKQDVEQQGVVALLLSVTCMAAAS